MLEALHPLAKKRKMADVDLSSVDAVFLHHGLRELEELSRQLKLVGRGTFRAHVSAPARARCASVFEALHLLAKRR